jgi:hypothetical protein
MSEISNQINVNGQYYPFRWQGAQLQAHHPSDGWIDVQDSGRRYGPPAKRGGTRGIYIVFEPVRTECIRQAAL